MAEWQKLYDFNNIICPKMDSLKVDKSIAEAILNWNIFQVIPGKYELLYT